MLDWGGDEGQSSKSLLVLSAIGTAFTAVESGEGEIPLPLEI